MKQDRRRQLYVERQIEHAQMKKHGAEMSPRNVPIAKSAPPQRVYKKANPTSTENSFHGSLKQTEVQGGKRSPSSNSDTASSHSGHYENRQEKESHDTEESSEAYEGAMDLVLGFLGCTSEREKKDNIPKELVNKATTVPDRPESHVETMTNNFAAPSARSQPPFERATDDFGPHGRPETPFEQPPIIHTPATQEQNKFQQNESSRARQTTPSIARSTKEEEGAFDSLVDILAFPEKWIGIESRQEERAPIPSLNSFDQSVDSGAFPERYDVNVLAFARSSKMASRTASVTDKYAVGHSDAVNGQLRPQKMKESTFEKVNEKPRSQKREESTFEKVMDFIAFPEKHCLRTSRRPTQDEQIPLEIVVDKNLALPNEKTPNKTENTFETLNEPTLPVYRKTEENTFEMVNEPPLYGKKEENTFEKVNEPLRPQKKETSTFENFMDFIAFPEKQCTRSSPIPRQAERDPVEIIVDDRIPNQELPKKTEGTVDKVNGPLLPQKKGKNAFWKKNEPPRPRNQKKEESKLEKFMDVVAFPEKLFPGTACDVWTPRRLRAKQDDRDGAVCRHDYDASYPTSQPSSNGVLTLDYDASNPTSQSISNGVLALDYSYDTSYPTSQPSSNGASSITGRLEAPGNSDSYGRWQDPEENDIIVKTTQNAWRPPTPTQTDLLDHVCSGVEKYTCGSPGGDVFKDTPLELRRNRSLISDTSSVSSVSSSRSQRWGWRSEKSRQSRKKPNLIERFASMR
jgi:hypothetical protein